VLPVIAACEPLRLAKVMSQRDLASASGCRSKPLFVAWSRAQQLARFVTVRKFGSGPRGCRRRKLLESSPSRYEADINSR